MEAVPLPAPYGGINDGVPVVALQSPQCESLFNFNVTTDGVELRNGDKIFLSSSDVITQTNKLFAYGDATAAFVVVYNGVNDVIYNIESGSVVHTIGAGQDNYFDLFFNNYLFLFNAAGGVYFDGSAWGTIGYTYGGSAFGGYGGNVYKNRAYIIRPDFPQYYYTNLYQVTGALPAEGLVDLTTIVSQKCFLVTIAAFTLSDQVSAITVQAFILSTGEILFYEGDYPNAANWQLLGRAKIGQPLSINEPFTYQGDSLILCDNGLISLRDLFLKGSAAAANLSVNSNIQETWEELVQTARTQYNNPTGPFLKSTTTGIVTGLWDPKTSRIIILFPFRLVSPGVVDEAGFYFVFDTEIQAWMTQRSYGGTRAYRDMMRFKNKVLLLTQTTTRMVVYEKEGATGFTDRNPADTGEVEYDYEIISAPISNGRMYVSRISSMDVIVNSDLHAQTNYYLIGDFGVQTTTAQKINAVSGVIQKTNANIGIEASFVQYKISGTTTSGKTVGYKLYGTNLWVSQGNRTR